MRARKYKSKVHSRIKAKQDPLESARNKNRFIISALIADAIENSGLQKGELAEKLNKYSSEVTKWTSGNHNFTIDTLSDIQEILGISLLPNYRHASKQTTLLCKLEVDINSTGSAISSKKNILQASTFIAEAGGMAVTSSSVE